MNYYSRNKYVADYRGASISAPVIWSRDEKYKGFTIGIEIRDWEDVKSWLFTAVGQMREYHIDGFGKDKAEWNKIRRIINLDSIKTMYDHILGKKVDIYIDITKKI